MQLDNNSCSKNCWCLVCDHTMNFLDLNKYVNQKIHLCISNVGVVVLLIISGFLTIISLVQKNLEHNFQYKNFVLGRVKQIWRGYVPAF